MTIQIPDELAARLAVNGSDLARRALEGFALEELRAGRITEPQLCEILGLACVELDEFFPRLMALIRGTLGKDFEQEQQVLQELCF